ncbi:MAG: (deoxy)nucleoside triphosphate pyrophosphohydrolase [Clostridia bacterium]|nr:(deoxy)nucleoside triphosphate pyrophosphohydrolase [Clostridia bacterium]
MTGERRVTAAVVLRGGRVLAARRAKGQKNEGMWEFPGGKVEAGETDEKCLEREMSEEFGITGRTLQHVTDSRYVYGAQGESILLCAYVFEWLAGEFELRVHDEIRWVNARELMELELSPADVKIAAKVGETLLF